MIQLRVAMMACIAVSNATAISIRHDVALHEYHSLANTPAYSSVGAFTVGGVQFCTGTLVGPDVVLTSSHCFDFVDPLQVGFSHYPSLPTSVAPNIAQVVMHPLANIYDENDLAFVYLQPSFRATAWSQISFDNPVGERGTFAGYGQHMDGEGRFVGQRTRFAAENQIDSRFRGWVETDFDSPRGITSTFGSEVPLALEGSTAFGDSGAPLFVGSHIVGVLWGGYNPYGFDSTYGDISQWIWLGSPTNKDFVKARTTAIIPELATGELLAACFCVIAGWRIVWFRRAGICFGQLSGSTGIGSGYGGSSLGYLRATPAPWRLCHRTNAHATGANAEGHAGTAADPAMKRRPNCPIPEDVNTTVPQP